jgi:transposase-like protein
MMTDKRSAEKTGRDIRRSTRRHYSAEEKIRVVLKGLRGEDSIAELYRREGINNNVYYRQSKGFLGVGKNAYLVIQQVKRHRMKSSIYVQSQQFNGRMHLSRTAVSN